MRRPPDLSCYLIEPDDEPPARTVPENSSPGTRYMQAEPWNRWSVWDWIGAVCPCVGRRPSEEVPTPDSACKVCNGTGTSHLEPEIVADGLYAEDARLLVHGAELLAACAGVLTLYDAALATGKSVTWKGELVDAMRAAVAKARGVR